MREKHGAINAHASQNVTIVECCTQKRAMWIAHQTIQEEGKKSEACEGTQN